MPDNDGVNRRNLLVIDSGEALTPSLGLAAAMALLGESQFEVSDFELHVGERKVPVDQRRAMWINYGGPGRHYPYFSFTDVIHGRVDLQQLRQKLVFVGATAPGVYDMRVTPFDGNVPGVEVHATVADNIVSGNFIQQGGVEALIDLIAIVLLTLLTYFLTMRIVLYAAIPVSVLLLAVYIWTAGKLLAGGNLLHHRLLLKCPLNPGQLSLTPFEARLEHGRTSNLLMPACHEQACQAAHPLIGDAVLFQADGGVQQVVGARAVVSVRAKSSGDNGFIAESAGIAGCVAIDHEGQRVHHAGVGVCVEPTGNVGACEHFPAPQQSEFFHHVFVVQPVSHSAAGAAAVERQYQAGPLG